MVTSTPSPVHPSDGSLAAAIGDAGRRANPRTLGLILAGGSVGVALVLLLARHHHMLAVPFVMPAAFGAWGLALHAERALEADGPGTAIERRLLQVVRASMIVVGAIAAVVSVLAVTFVIAGPAPVL